MVAEMKVSFGDDIRVRVKNPIDGTEGDVAHLPQAAASLLTR